MLFRDARPDRRSDLAALTYRPSIGSPELHPSPAALDLVAALMHELVMVRAELYEVVQIRWSSTYPVLDVVCVQVPVVGAAGEPAAAITAAQRPAQRRGNGARAPADRERLSIALDERDQRGITTEPPGGLGGQRRTTGQLRLALDLVRRKRLGVDVYDHLGRVLPASCKYRQRLCPHSAGTELAYVLGH